jgi:hypothetical protein
MRTPLQKGEQILLVTHTSWVKLIVPVLIAVAGWVAAYFIGLAEYKNIQLANQAQHMATAMSMQADVKYTSPGSHSIASELEKLHQLKQQGIITEEEYNKAKNKLLG